MTFKYPQVWAFFFLSSLIANVDMARAQGGGLLPEDPAVMDSIEFVDFRDRRMNLPTQYNLFDALGIPTPQPPCNTFPIDQGDCNSCAGCAIAHACSFHHAHRSKICDGESEWTNFSGSFVYNQIKKSGDCKSGARISDGLNQTVLQGICPATLFPNSRYACAKQPDSEQLQAAAAYKIKAYKKIFASAMLMNTNEIVEQIKGAISNNNPVIVGANLPNSIIGLARGKCDWIPNPDNKFTLHALVIVAYGNDHFEVLNSLGCRWGCDGFAKIPCNELAGMLDSAFIMNPVPCD